MKFYRDGRITKIPEFYLRYAHQAEVHRGSEHYLGTLGRIQELQNEVNGMNDSNHSQNAESLRS